MDMINNLPFKVSDLVQLKTGGPTMTVQKITPEGIDCVWFNSRKEPCRGHWFAASLMPTPREVDDEADENE